MATYLFIGQKGSGKSATLTQRIHDTLYDILVRKIGEDRIIVTDVAVKFQKMRREFLSRYKVDIEGKLFCRKKGFQFKHTQWLRRFYADRGNDRLVFEHYIADDTGYKAVRLAAPPRQRVVYVLDEIIVGFRARDTMRCWNAEIEYYMEFEDQIGDDVYAATQHEDLLDVNFLRLCNHVIRLVNTEQRMIMGFRIPGWMAGGRFLSRWYSDVSPTAPCQREEARRFIPWLAECYNTDSLHGRGGERHENKLGKHWSKAIVPMGVVLVIFASLPFVASAQWTKFWKGKQMTPAGAAPIRAVRQESTKPTTDLSLPAFVPQPLPVATFTRTVPPAPVITNILPEVHSPPPSRPAPVIISAMSLDGRITRVRWSDGRITEERGKWVGWTYTSESGVVFDPDLPTVINRISRAAAIRSSASEPVPMVPAGVGRYIEQLRKGKDWRQ